MKKKRIIFSSISSLLLILLTYFANNSPLFTGESALQYYVIQSVFDWRHKSVDYGDAVFYDVSFDKMLITAISDDGKNDNLGVKAVTDRQKLLRFLILLKKTDKYKHVIVDLVFDKNDRSVYDDSLFYQILQMRDITIANSSNITISDSTLVTQGKTGMIDYYITNANTNFGRWEYMTSESKSLPLVVYEKINPEKRMKKFGWGRFAFYTIGGRLCQNGCFLTFDKSYVEPVFEKLPNQRLATHDNYINLGSFISEPLYGEQLLLNLTEKQSENKYVVIGNFKEDQHDTYMGRISGSIIVMRALATLEEGGNRVYLFHELLWFVVFFLINMSILSDKPISRRIPLVRKTNRKWIHFLFSIVTFAGILIVCTTLEYLLDYPVSSIIIPSLYFSILKTIVRYKNTPLS
jgi:hypothetical protein